ncbi:MAG TPA: PAS domain S-box protein [Candidatus Faecaligallichristensenella faecipullorum]|nr:PAS domain S-box protein [Candidatus Faecaligallichristensenella faecipullorum]
MKKRVAFLAACLNFLLCIAGLAVYAWDNMQENNMLERQNLTELAHLARSSYEQVETLDAESRQHLQTLEQDADACITLLAPDGQLIYDTKPDLFEPEDVLAQPEIAAAMANGEGSGQHEIKAGEYVGAAVRLDNGNVLRLYRPAQNFSQQMSAHKLGFLALAALLSVGLYGVIFYLLGRSDTLLRKTSGVMEAFSEGRFDARITGMGKRPGALVNLFNERADRIQERLFQQKGRNEALSAVINCMQTGILAVDQQMKVMLITPMAKQLLGFAGNAEGVPVQQFADVHLETIFQEAMAQEGVYTNEVAARTGMGRNRRPLRLYVSPMKQDDVVVGAVALVEDITELRRLEQVRTDFAANVSHELKTPLTSIKGFVETLQAGAINQPEMAQKFLNIIMMEADRLTRLINDILSISKLESGDDQVTNERIRLDKMASDVVDMLSIHAKEKEITLHTSIDPDPVVIWGNPDRVEQMLINLVDNGIKYNKPGGSVTVKVFNNEKNVNLLVSDTGIGIAEEHIPRLFERFYRVDKGRSRSMGGTGLGLAIVKHIVMSMNGLIEVHSKLGEGTEFLVTLPKEAPVVEKKAQPAHPQEDIFEDTEENYEED